jgi:WD40 repeat protein
MIITCSNDLSVSFWNINLQAGTITKHSRYGYTHNNIVYGIIKVKDNIIASFSNDNDIKIYNMQTQSTINVNYPNDDNKTWTCYAINAYTNNKKESFIIGSFVYRNDNCFIRFFNINGVKCETIERVYTDCQRGLFVTKDNKELIVACFIDRVKNAFVIIDLFKKVITKTINVNSNITLTKPLYITKYKDTLLCGTSTYIIQFNIDGIMNTFEFPVKDTEKEEYKELFSFGLGIVETRGTQGTIVGINRTGLKQPISGGRNKLLLSFGLTLFNPA